MKERIFENFNLDKQNKKNQQLEQQNTQLISIIENLSEGVILADDKGIFIMVNPQAKKLIYQCDKVIDIGDDHKKSRAFDLRGNEIPYENFSQIRALRGERVKNAKISIRHPNKECFLEASSIPIYNASGDLTMVVSYFHDVTETIKQSRKTEEICNRAMTKYLKQEEAIRRRYEMLNRVIDTFSLPVATLSCPDLKIKDINKKAFDIIKLLSGNFKSIEHIKDKKIEDIFKAFKTSDYYQCIREVLKEKKTKRLNKKKHWVNEEEVYCNIIFEPLFEGDGEVQEILILIIDVTPEIKSTIGMEKALKLQGEFIVNISHELKTPLNVICATAQLFNMYCTSGSLDEKKDTIIKYIESINQNSYRLSKIINNIVDLSKIEAGFFKLNLSNNNIVEVVEEIVTSVTTFTDSKGLNIIFDTDVEEKIIACDTEKTERIVLNLISNAIKFSDAGDEIFVAVKDKNEFVEISVKDNGIGIEEKDLDMIFDRFKQVEKSLSRNTEGTGIGLSFVKSIVELHGGSISVESKFGKGSKFTVKIPSRKVLKENMIYSSKVPSINQSIRVELSDVYK
ncbi:MAG: PAS domain-containing sensor histidine kinase [Clostridium sp.]|uniref:PAS domain-containing sensor histidine kinase n=1 Tax=Clostridium sp. TaxID=1506 RepID=UPI003D6C7FA8